MGRSVSYPIDCSAICFRDVSGFGYEYDEETGETNFNNFDEFQAQDDFEWFIDDIRYQAKAKWKTFDECDTWLDREDHAILENNFAYIGVSEYCGCASVWLKSKADNLKDGDYSDDISLANLAEAWCNRIAKNFESMFGEYRKIGTFSNGEAVFEKIAS